MSSDLVVAFTGASGSPYGLRLVEVLLRAGRTVHLTISPAAVEVFGHEVGRPLRLGEEEFDAAGLLGPSADGLDLSRLRYHHFRNFRAGIASGSFLTGGMAVCPCSMGTLARVVAGFSSNLVERAADVALKEGRTLLVVPREAPLSALHLENMLRLVRLGGIVLPAAPGFYHHPRSVDDLVQHVVGKILDRLGLAHARGARWQGQLEPPPEAGTERGGGP